MHIVYKHVQGGFFVFQTTLSECVPLIFMSFAVGMDAFSVSLGIGMQEIRLKRIAVIGLIIGLFHVIMPFTGILLASIISGKIGHLATLIGGALLFAIGAHMIFSAFSQEAKHHLKLTGTGIWILAFIVSIDSFSVGIGLGLSGAKTLITLFLFGVTSMVLTWIGMVLGRKVHGLLDVYSEILGGSILCGFGLYIIFA